MTSHALDTESAWKLILLAENRTGVTLAHPGSEEPALELNSIGEWRLLVPATEEASALLSVFLPLCPPLAAGAPLHVIGQLGQSLDGRIATVTGHSRFINGNDGIVHLHRIRALSDAVVVGAGTAATDNPQLTVRCTSGENPVRVVVDRNRRVPESHHLFTDGAAPTLRLVAGDYTPGMAEGYGERAVIEIPCLGNGIEPVSPKLILEVLADLGLKKIFVEGGGMTISSFLEVGLLNRLHVMVAPMIIGSGRPAFSLPEIDFLDDALRPASRFVNLGTDMLFDLDFSISLPAN
ncbi:riboflavin-specific deaminase C-terminal domain-containing protein [Marinobacter sp. LV10R510-11A]|uniref:RibD family protein n=1 Tax=Marinobacter sp. LV10R510-11A TaxID=1415568 RepID=UPI000BB928E4|nr:RibD family protein [Marinobacter sp. LV10R510-11A]SOB75125.1 riboflavin-specific deaminase C-terminal domain-containing protein [Marinobacter sp. LV10R510-11A]